MRRNKLKIKIAVGAALCALVAFCFTGAKISSQTKSKDEKPVIEKASIACRVQANRNGMATDELKTTVLRAKPDKNAAIAKSVSYKDEVIYQITGTNGAGWFEIAKIETTGGDTEETIFEGRGWLHSSELWLSVAGSDPRLYAKPSKKSHILKKLVVDESETLPLSCQGDWMKIKSGKLTGWLSPAGQCANPLTTCS